MLAVPRAVRIASKYARPDDNAGMAIPLSAAAATTRRNAT